MHKLGTQILWSIVYLLIGGLIFILGLNLLTRIPGPFRDEYKLGLPVVLLLAAILAWKFLPAQKMVFLAFFLVAAAWALDFYLTGRVKGWFQLNTITLSGMAWTMVISTLMVSVPVILGWLLAGGKPADLFLAGSSKAWGLWGGLAGLLLFGGLGVLQAWGQAGLPIKTVVAALPLALLFSLANAFREELVYRAVFLKGFEASIGLIATILVTTAVFAVAHVDVSYLPPSQIVFAVVLVIIGVAGSLIMLKTGSLLGAVLFHAGADVLLILGLVASNQLVLS
jgi:membrane protease YdiL (CAAX protease family)